MSLKILVIGAGITSSVIGAMLKTFQLPCQITLWDKARGAGGRMCTSRSPRDPTCTADIGAQYITAQPHYLQAHSDFYNSLVMSKVLEPLVSHIEGINSEGTCHYVAPNGMSSIVKHFIQEGDCQVKFEHHVNVINRAGDDGWVVRTVTGHEETFNAVILTMPVPQILQLSGDVADILGKNATLTDGLRAVKYSARYVLGLFYNGISPPNLNWDAKYIRDHDTFRFVSFDNRKRHRADLPTAVVFHTSVDFGFKHIDKKLEDIQPMLMCKVKELFPEWPEPSHIKCHKWRYSQVLTSYANAPGFVTLEDNPLLIAAGDGFTHSGLDGCIASALAATQTVSEFVTLKDLGIKLR